MLRAAIVPERDRVLGPAEAALEQRVLAVLIEITENRVALVAWHAGEVRGEAAVHVERSSARDRMRADDRMFRAGISRFVRHAIVRVEPAIGELSVMQRGEPIE